ncbi:unnamed protein product, partial [Porites lobata]
MFRTKGILLVTTFLCFPGVISATCPSPRYSALKDTLQSPGYSMGKYPANQSCTYDVRVPDGKRIILDFKRFDILGSMPDCLQDSLEIIPGYGTQPTEQYYRTELQLKSLSKIKSENLRPIQSLNEFFHFNFRCGNLNRSLGKFCSCSNLSMPDKIYTYDNCLTLVFISDGSNQGLGFQAEYTTTDNNVTRL